MLGASLRLYKGFRIKPEIPRPNRGQDLKKNDNGMNISGHMAPAPPANIDQGPLDHIYPCWNISSIHIIISRLVDNTVLKAADYIHRLSTK